MEIHKVGVVGCGLMGSGISQAAAVAGFPTVVRELSQELLDRGLTSIARSLAKFVEKGELILVDGDKPQDVVANGLYSKVLSLIENHGKER